MDETADLIRVRTALLLLKYSKRVLEIYSRPLTEAACNELRDLLTTFLTMECETKDYLGRNFADGSDHRFTSEDGNFIRRQ